VARWLPRLLQLKVAIDGDPRGINQTRAATRERNRQDYSSTSLLIRDLILTKRWESNCLETAVVVRPVVICNNAEKYQCALGKKAQYQTMLRNNGVKADHPRKLPGKIGAATRSGRSNGGVDTLDDLAATAREGAGIWADIPQIDGLAEFHLYQGIRIHPLDARQWIGRGRSEIRGD